MDASLEVGNFGGGGGVSKGQTSVYEVRVPEEAYTPELAVDPYDPTSLPAGSAILVENNQFTGIRAEASYRGLETSSSVTHTEGTSSLIEKTDEDTVRVTVGPTEAITNNFQVGLSFGPAELHAGNTTLATDATLQTAEFDLSQEEGQAAYEHFLATGEVPAENGSGVSNATTLQRITYDSTTRMGGSLYSIGGDAEIANNNGHQTLITYPDGSMDVSTHLEYAGSPMHIEQHFLPPAAGQSQPGQEDLSRQRVTFSLRDVPVDTARSLMTDLSDDPSAAAGLPEKGEVTLTVTLDSEQMAGLQQDFGAFRDQFGDTWDPKFSPMHRWHTGVADAPTTFDAALTFSQLSALGMLDSDVALRLLEISKHNGLDGGAVQVSFEAEG